jgi:hypothetical protein
VVKMAVVTRRRTRKAAAEVVAEVAVIDPQSGGQPTRGSGAR